MCQYTIVKIIKWGIEPQIPQYCQYCLIRQYYIRNIVIWVTLLSSKCLLRPYYIRNTPRLVSVISPILCRDSIISEILLDYHQYCPMRQHLSSIFSENALFIHQYCITKTFRWDSSVSQILSDEAAFYQYCQMRQYFIISFVTWGSTVTEILSNETVGISQIL